MLLEGEMDAHLSREARENGNRRNGKMSKQVQTQYGEITLETAIVMVPFSQKQ